MRDGGILHPAESLPFSGCFILIALFFLLGQPWEGCMIGYVFTLQSGRLNTGWDPCEHRTGTWTVSSLLGNPLGPVWERPGVLSSVLSVGPLRCLQPPAWESITQLPVFLRAEQEQDSASSEQTVTQSPAFTWEASSLWSEGRDTSNSAQERKNKPLPSSEYPFKTQRPPSQGPLLNPPPQNFPLT